MSKRETKDFAFIRKLLDSSEYTDRLVERAKRGDQAIIRLLQSYARDPRPTSARARARRVLMAAGVGWEARR